MIRELRLIAEYLLCLWFLSQCSSWILRPHTNKRLWFMDIEVVGDKVPAGCGHRAFYHFPDMGYEVIFIACIAASNGVNLSVGYRKAHDEWLSSMPDVFKLPAFHFSWCHWQSRVFAFESLYPSHFIDAHYDFTFLSQINGLLIQWIDIVYLFVELIVRSRC